MAVATKNGCIVYTPTVFASYQQRLKNGAELKKLMACDGDVSQLAGEFLDLLADPGVDVELKKDTLATFAAEMYARGIKAGSERRAPQSCRRSSEVCAFTESERQKQ